MILALDGLVLSGLETGEEEETKKINGLFKFCLRILYFSSAYILMV